MLAKTSANSRRLVAALLATILLSASSALAEPAFSLENLVLNTDGTGTIDVLLRIHSGTYNIAGYSIGLEVEDSTGAFEFTGTDALDPYLFGDDSFGLLTDPLPATSLVAFDTYFDPTGTLDGVSLSEGESRGLLRVAFSGVGLGTITVRVAKDPFLTNLTGGNGDSIEGLHLGDPIVISDSVVPEPSSLLLSMGGAGMLALILNRRRQSSLPPVTKG